MEPRTVALIIDGTLAFTAIVAGCLQLRYGLHVFRAGHGTASARTKLHFGKWSIDTGSTGVAVMALASLWALAAIELRPVLKNQSAESYEVASASPHGTDVLLAHGEAAFEQKKHLAREFVSSSLQSGDANKFDLSNVSVTSYSPECSIISVPIRDAQRPLVAQYLPVTVRQSPNTKFVPIAVPAQEIASDGTTNQFEVLLTHGTVEVQAAKRDTGTERPVPNPPTSTTVK